MRADEPGNRNARGRATARAIERAAVQLAAATGADGFTVQDVCAEVGITERTFFNHFAAKEDALLGWDAPHVDDAAVVRYLADPEIGLLTGALALVELPDELLYDPELARARMRVVGSSPALAARQAERLIPLVGEVATVIARKLRGILDRSIPDAQVIAAARVLAGMGAGLMISQASPGFPLAGPPGALPAHPAEALRLLGTVADRLF